MQDINNKLLTSDRPVSPTIDKDISTQLVNQSKSTQAIISDTTGVLKNVGHEVKFVSNDKEVRISPGVHIPPDSPPV